MQQWSDRIEIATGGRGLVDVTRPVEAWVCGHRVMTGLLTIWIRHTSASLLVTENASPDVRRDLEVWLARLAPDGGPERYAHAEEGPDDMPAHLRAAVLPVSLSIPVVEGRLALGTWQGVFVYEHRAQSHRRELALHLLG